MYACAARLRRVTGELLADEPIHGISVALYGDEPTSSRSAKPAVMLLIGCCCLLLVSACGADAPSIDDAVLEDVFVVNRTERELQEDPWNNLISLVDQKELTLQLLMSPEEKVR